MINSTMNNEMAKTRKLNRLPWLIVGLAIVIMVLLYGKSKLGDFYLNYQKSQLPPAQTVEQFEESPETTEPTMETPATLEAQVAPITEETKPQEVTPTEPVTQIAPVVTPPPAVNQVNLDIPFTSQAPHAVWDELHDDFCEEASAAMVSRYFQNQGFSSADDADAEMMKIYDWENANLGYWKDTDVFDTSRFINELYSLKTEIVDFNIDVIKQALTDGKPVIMPAAGQKLGNPYFTPPGPVYHMLVIKGYTSDGRFITNDPGTKRGANYIYSEDTISNAVGDYNNGDPANGPKKVIIVTK